MTALSSVRVPGSGLVDTVSISVKSVSKTYRRNGLQTDALVDVELQVLDGEFMCLLGRSGCGKSTLLNLIAGLDFPTRGVIDTGQRKVGVMFQDANLFPWLSVKGNIELALRLSNVPRTEFKERVESLLESVRLPGIGNLRPHELSGGMRQRAALAKTLAQDCQILLMDEPFGALDSFTRDAMHDETERICSERELTVVFVTHNAREAVRLADRVLIMAPSPGRVDKEMAIELARPRNAESIDVSALAAQLSDHIRTQRS